MQLILGCGPNWPKRENDVFVDCRKFDNVDKVHDLNICPWPFNNDSVNEIVAIHLVEHLNNLLDFMDECWRVLKKGGALYIETPEAGADIDLQFADPTHIRCYRKHTFINYFTLSEAPKFGYTDKLWAIMHIESKNNNLIVHLTPLK